jgi:hypothetical protein
MVEMTTCRGFAHGAEALFSVKKSSLHREKIVIMIFSFRHYDFFISSL